MSHPDEFRDCLLEAVDRGLNVLGEVVRQTIFECIEKDHRLTRREIPERLEDFHEALGRVFGASAKTVERLIAKGLYQRLGLNFAAHNSWTLLDYVNHAKRSQANEPRGG